MRATAFRLVEAAQAIPLPTRIASEAQHVHEARIAFIKRMGTNWVHHPAYVFNPRHSRDPNIYGPARAAYVEKVAQLGKQARMRNPAFIRADEISRVIGGSQ